MSREEKVAELCRPSVEAMGFEWVGVEYHHNTHNAILRIYVDRREGGITMEDVVAVTEQLNPLLDVEDPIQSPYTLEVSSPGLDRPLFTLAQYARFTGAPVKLLLKRAAGGQRRFTGVIAAVDEAAETVALSFPEDKSREDVTLEYANIERARLVPVFED